jgi:hypothetical protein
MPLAANEQEACDNIFQSDRIKSILNHCKHNTFVVFDLDNTLVESTQDLGSDQWFVKLMEETCRLLPGKETVELVVAIYYAVQRQVSLKTVEHQTISLITLLQDLNIPIVVLTARGDKICRTTIEELKRIGIDFSKQWSNMEYLLKLNDGKSRAFFSNGIIFCDGNDKGKCLLSFFQSIKNQPAHVLMVDDKEKHLKSVRAVIDAYQGKFTGIRYSLLDEKIKKVDMKSANEQMKKMLHAFPHDVKQALAKIGLVDYPMTLNSPRLSSAHLQDESKELSVSLPFFREKRKLVRTMSCPELRKSKGI